MGKRDKGGRETRKPKKDAKKGLTTTTFAAPITVEVVKRGKKDRGEEAEP